MLYATIGQGEISVRDNPDAATDGSLDGLNRDLDKTREVTKDEQEGVDVYVSKGSIDEVMNLGAGIRQKIKGYEEQIEDAIAFVEEAFSDETAADLDLALDFREVLKGAYQMALDEGKSPEEAEQAQLQALGKLELFGKLIGTIDYYGSLEAVPTEAILDILSQYPEYASLSGAGELLAGAGLRGLELTVGAKDFLASFLKGAFSPLIPGDPWHDENLFAQQVMAELASLPDKAFSGELSDNFRKALDQAMWKIDQYDQDLGLAGEGFVDLFLVLGAIAGGQPEVVASLEASAPVLSAIIKGDKVVPETGIGALKPLGLGSTGRTTATNLAEQMAMKEALSNPGAGTVIMEGLKDTRWSGWSKMQYMHTTLDGKEIIIHYVGKFENGALKSVDDFKFK